MAADKYLKSALEGRCEEVRMTQPGQQAQKLYDLAYYLAARAVEHGLDDHWFSDIEHDLVQCGLQMDNAPSRERWTEAQIRTQIKNGVRDGKAAPRESSVSRDWKAPINKTCSPNTPVLPTQSGELRRFTYEVGGQPVLIKVRYDGGPKYLPYYLDVNPDGTPYWNIHKPAGFRYVPYQFDRLKATQGTTIYITEGERDADSLIELGLCATSFGSAGSFPPQAEMYFTGRDIVVVGDDDDAGRKHVEAISQKLNGVARSIRGWTPRGNKPGYDVTDWIADHPDADLAKVIEGETNPATSDPGNVVVFAQGMEARLSAHESPQPNDRANRFRPHLISAEDELGDLEYLVEGVLPLRGYCLLYGGSGLGKSYVAIDLALAVKNELPWGGRTTHQGEVVYIAAEDPNGIHVRSTAQLKASGDLNGFHILKEPVNLSQEALDVGEVIEGIRDVLKDNKLALVIVDTFQRVSGGIEENSSSEVMGIVRSLDQISRAFDCLVVLIHHVGKSASGPRGTSAFKDAADTVIGITGSTNRRTLTVEKQRNGPGDITSSFTLEDIPKAEMCRVKFLDDWGGLPPSSAKKLNDDEAKQIQNAVIEVLQMYQVETGQSAMPRQDLRQHNSIIPLLAGKQKKTADKAFERAIKKLEERMLVVCDGQTVSLVEAQATTSDMSPDVAAMSPKAA